MGTMAKMKKSTLRVNIVSLWGERFILLGLYMRTVQSDAAWMLNQHRHESARNHRAAWIQVRWHLCVTSLRQRHHNTRLNDRRRTRWACHRGELERRKFATKLSENRLACCLHTIYYKCPYILLYMRCFYKYMECSSLFYCGHEVNMHEACGRAKGCDRV